MGSVWSAGLAYPDTARPCASHFSCPCHVYWLVFELKGHPSQKWLKKGQFKDEHFADDGKFKFEEVDKITKKVKISMLSLAKPSKDLKSLLLRNHKLSADEEVHFNNFRDLLEKMLMVDPDKRISAKDALKHPFIVTKM
eukprot:m.123462 g.123462  ORF g.123462 m.123462 type:complete len:139 (+) comp15679_c0_seq1:1803-2219(+)